MTPEFLAKWQHIVEDVEKSKIPVQFIKKLVLKLDGKRQHTINIQKLIREGLDAEQLENVVSKRLKELEDDIQSVEFVLDVATIAKAVQPETDRILGKL